MFRKFLLTTLSTFAFLFVFQRETRAQLVNVPQAAKEAFDKKYPEAKEVDWTNNIGDPEVKFTQDGQTCTARFNKDGKWMWTYTSISEESIPAEVKVGFSKSKYAEWLVKKVTMIEKPEKTEYQLTVTKGTMNSQNLLFNHNGRLLKNSYTI